MGFIRWIKSCLEYIKLRKEGRRERELHDMLSGGSGCCKDHIDL